MVTVRRLDESLGEREAVSQKVQSSGCFLQMVRMSLGQGGFSPGFQCKISLGLEGKKTASRMCGRWCRVPKEVSGTVTPSPWSSCSGAIKSEAAFTAP